MVSQNLIYEYGPARPHPGYAEWATIWAKCRDVLGGEEAIKRAEETYLPKMEAMSDSEYEGYKTRAMFYGASQRTLQGLMGALLRKEPLLFCDDKARVKLETLFKNITQTGVDLQAFCRDLVEEILSVGRVGVLADMPETGGVPYARLYKAEHIINWREKYVNGVPFLEQVILQEIQEFPSASGFGSDWLVQYRELLIEDGIYIQRVYIIDPPDAEVTDAEPQVRVTDEIIPRYLGKPLTQIPFSFISSTHMRPDVNRPPLLDLFNVNLSHYRSSADLEHGRHFTALPTPWVSGVEDEDEQGKPTTLRIGSGTAWLLPQGAQARMLEFNGQGLKHLENALSEKQQLMVNLGARMLEQDKRASETAEALRLRQAGDIASLNVLADTVASALTKIIRVLSWWAGITKTVDDDSLFVTLSKDFFEARLAPEMITSLVSAWQSGAFSFKDLYDNLVRGEVIDAQREYDEVKNEVEKEVELRQKSLAIHTIGKGSSATPPGAGKGSAGGRPSTQ